MLAALPEARVASSPALLLASVVPWQGARFVVSPIDLSLFQRFLRGGNWGDDWKRCWEAEAVL
jgi:hypothetical protein